MKFIEKDHNNYFLIILTGILTLCPLIIQNAYFSARNFESLYRFGLWWPLFHRPLARLFFNFCKFFFSFNPQGYNVIGVVVHIVNSLLVYHLVKLVNKNKKIALVAALFFSIFCANYAALLEMDTLEEKLAAFFYVLCVIFYIKFVNLPGSNKKRLFYFISFFSFILGLVSRETLYSLPLILLAYEMFFMNESITLALIKKKILRISPFLLIAFVHIMIAATKFPDGYRIKERLGFLFSFPQGLVINIATLMKLLFIPFDFQYSTVAFGDTQYHALYNSFLIVAIFIFLIFLIKEKSYKFSLCWIILTILPVATRAYRVEERGLYLASIGASFLLSLLIQDGIKRICAKKMNVFLPAIKVILVFGILLSFYISLNNRINAKIRAGKIVKEAFASMKNAITKDSPGVVIYAFNFPISIERINEAFFVYTKRSLAPFYYWGEQSGKNWYSIDYRGQGDVRKVIYMMLLDKKMVKEIPFPDPKDCTEFIKDEEVIKGLNNVFPYTFPRYVFLYQKGKILDLTEKFFPKTEVVFKLKASFAKSISIAGDFNNWNREANPFILNTQGIWEARILLSPGEYVYKFITDGKKWVINPASEYVDDPIRGKCSILAVANHAIPFGLLPSGDLEYDHKVIECKKSLIVEPGSFSLHNKLRNLYAQKGFYEEADLEYEEAQ